MFNRRLTLMFLLGSVIGCTGVPNGISPATEFEVNRYTGTWYEIARLDHKFERGLSKVRAEYRLEDGIIQVLNKGFDAEKGEWSEAKGKARFVNDDDVGHLKVSFFGPFYASYVIFELDKSNYSIAYVTGYNKDYLWLLSRSKTISDDEKRKFLQRIGELGFNTEELIWVEQ